MPPYVKISTRGDGVSLPGLAACWDPSILLQPRCPLADNRGSLIQQVKDASDIVDVIGNYVSLRPAGTTFKGLCPFHDDHNPSFTVDPKRQRYRCWSCQKNGDVIFFIQEQERIGFTEALELLARRAGITLEKRAESPQKRQRALMLDGVSWASEQYQRCLLDSPLAESARRYLGERRLAGETVRRFGLGFAPPHGDWLVQNANRAGVSLELLEQVGLVALRQDGTGFYDRFRDRVLFPIRNPRGDTVGFGGRILPSSPAAQKAPKYYNSSDTELFSKSEQLYGIDLARQAGAKAGYLAVVEGYTDVLMAHQCGVGQVVATMGTALNVRHVQQLRRFAERVVLVFDADEGGDTGVDRALEVFASQEVDLRIATLPSGLDPCDLLVEKGAEPFVQALEDAVDALEFKLNRVLKPGETRGVEERMAGMESVLRIIALAGSAPGSTGAVKRELMIGLIARRLALKEETVWRRLKELEGEQRERPARAFETEVKQAPRSAPAPPEERELLTVLLADPLLVPAAAREVRPEELQHPGLRRLLEGLYGLQAEGKPPTLDMLRDRIDEPRLIGKALEWQEIGLSNGDRPAWFQMIVQEFRRKRQTVPRVEELKNQLHADINHATALELLRRLQNPI
jgi:DNA primase